MKVLSLFVTKNAKYFFSSIYFQPISTCKNMVYFICGSILKSLYKGELEHFSKPKIDVKQHPKIKFDYYATNYRLKPLF